MKEQCFFINVQVLRDTENVTKSFLTWTEDINFDGKWIILPDGSKVDGTIWMMPNMVFDNGSYTKFLLNYYKDNFL